MNGSARLRWVFLAAVLGLWMAGAGSCASPEVVRVRQMLIQDVDLRAVPDGTYRGDFSYARFTYEVEIAVKDHHITSVQVLKNRTTSYARKAEGVVPRVLEKQTPNVDAVTGATTTSKALLKAIENALAKAIMY